MLHTYPSHSTFWMSCCIGPPLSDSTGGSSRCSLSALPSFQWIQITANGKFHAAATPPSLLQTRCPSSHQTPNKSRKYHKTPLKTTEAIYNSDKNGAIASWDSHSKIALQYILRVERKNSYIQLEDSVSTWSLFGIYLGFGFQRFHSFPKY